MYPQTVVPLTSDIHKHLRDNHVNQTGDVKLLDGVYYTANMDNQETWNPTNDTTWEKNPVYQYGSDRYVRVTPYSYNAYHATNYPQYTYNNGEPMERVNVASGTAQNYRWFKVEPIKWIILNSNDDNITFVQSDEIRYGDIVTDLPTIRVESQNNTPLELYAADVLMGGIPYDSANFNIWNSERTMYKYLNNEFYSQAFSETDKSLIQDSKIYNNTTSGQRTDPAYNLNSNHFPVGGMNPTSQKIYLLSRYELENVASPYVVEGNKIFAANELMTANESRQVLGTDYARAHYLWLGTSAGKSYANYWTRSAYNAPYVYCVTTTGSIDYNGATLANSGQRPALQLKLNRLV